MKFWHGFISVFNSPELGELTAIFALLSFGILLAAPIAWFLSRFEN